MKVLVTGCAGLIGSWVAKSLLANGCEVVGVDSLIGGSINNVPKGVAFIHSLAEEVTCEKCDVVCHTAALPYEGLSYLSPKIITSSIVDTTIAVAVNAINANVKRFVNFSSIARYGKAQLPYTEATIPEPADPYGSAKLFAERQLDMICHQYGVDTVHIAPHNVIGPGQKYDDPYRNVVAIFANLMLQSRQPIIYGDGTQTRSFSHVKDVASCVVTAALRERPFEGRLYNVGPDDEPMTILELANIVAKETGLTLNPKFVSSRPNECKHAHSLNDRARVELDFNRTISARDAIIETVEYIKKCGPKPFSYHLPLELHRDNIWASKAF